MARLVTHRKRRDPFLRIERDVMEDPTLSFKAKALYGWLLDKGEFPGGWETDIDRIASITSDGAFAIRAALLELEQARRLERSDDKHGGRGKRAEWHVYDDPKGAENREVPDEAKGVDNREVSNEVDAETASVERGNRDSHLITERLSFSETNNARRAHTGGIDVDFAAFWFAYPRKSARPAARRAWKTARAKKPPAEIMAALAKWVEAWAARNAPEFVPYPATWLNQERWNDEPLLLSGRTVAGEVDEIEAAIARAEAARR